MNIEKKLFPNAWQLKVDEFGVGESQIVDVSLDPFRVVFSTTGVMEVDASKYQFIELDIPTLRKMIKLIKQYDASVSAMESNGDFDANQSFTINQQSK